MWRASGTIPWSSPHLPTRPPGRKYTPAGATPIQFFSASVTPVYSWFFSTGSAITRAAARAARPAAEGPRVEGAGIGRVGRADDGGPRGVDPPLRPRAPVPRELVAEARR